MTTFRTDDPNTDPTLNRTDERASTTSPELAQLLAKPELTWPERLRLIELHMLDVGLDQAWVDYWRTRREDSTPKRLGGDDALPPGMTLARAKALVPSATNQRELVIGIAIYFETLVRRLYEPHDGMRAVLTAPAGRADASDLERALVHLSTRRHDARTEAERELAAERDRRDAATTQAWDAQWRTTIGAAQRDAQVRADSDAREKRTANLDDEWNNQWKRTIAPPTDRADAHRAQAIANWGNEWRTNLERCAAERAAINEPSEPTVAPTEP